MLFAIILGLVGLFMITLAICSDITLFGICGCLTCICGTVQMISCHFDFPWPLFYCLGLALGLLITLCWAPINNRASSLTEKKI